MAVLRRDGRLQNCDFREKINWHFIKKWKSVLNRGWGGDGDAQSTPNYYLYKCIDPDQPVFHSCSVPGPPKTLIPALSIFSPLPKYFGNHSKRLSIEVGVVLHTPRTVQTIIYTSVYTHTNLFSIHVRSPARQRHSTDKKSTARWCYANLINPISVHTFTVDNQETIQLECTCFVILWTKRTQLFLNSCSWMRTHSYTTPGSHTKIRMSKTKNRSVLEIIHLQNFSLPRYFFLRWRNHQGREGMNQHNAPSKKYSRPSLQAEPSGTFSIFVWTVFRLNLQRFLNVLLEFGFF